MPSTFFCVLKGIELRVFYTFNAPENYTVQNVIDHIHQVCHEERPIIYYVYNEILGRIQEVQLGERLFPRDALASQVFDEYNILFVPNEEQEAAAAEEDQDQDEEEEEEEEQQPASFFDPVLANIAASLMPRAAHFMSLDEMFVLAENMSYFNMLLGGVVDDWVPPPPPPPLINDSETAMGGIEVEELDRQYPVFLHQKQEQEQANCCCVCLEAYEKEDRCRKMACAHVFHQTCIDRWLSRHTQCPVCRAECGF